jgi:hypothetical protein
MVLGDGSEDKEELCDALRRPIHCRPVLMVLMLPELLGLVAMFAAD